MSFFLPCSIFFSLHLPPSNTLYSTVSHQNKSTTRTETSALFIDVHFEQCLAHSKSSINMCGISKTPRYPRQESLPSNNEIFISHFPCSSFNSFFFPETRKKHVPPLPSLGPTPKPMVCSWAGGIGSLIFFNVQTINQLTPWTSPWMLLKH